MPLRRLIVRTRAPVHPPNEWAGAPGALRDQARLASGTMAANPVRKNAARRTTAVHNPERVTICRGGRIGFVVTNV